MARKRMISPLIWESKSFSKLTDIAKLTFIGLFNLADDEGYGKADSSFIRCKLFPYDKDRRITDIDKALQEIGSNMSIIFYEVDGDNFYYLTHWTHWQKVEKPSPSTIPKPSGMGVRGSFTQKQQFGEQSGNDTGAVGEHSPTKIKSNQIDDNNTHNSIYLTRTRGDWKTHLNTCVNVDNLSDIMETCFNDTISAKQIETLLLDFLDKGENIVIGGKEYDFITVAKKIESIDTNTFTAILQNLYVKQEGVPTQEWKRKKITNLLHYALTAILK